MHIINNPPSNPATHSEIAALEFGAVAEFRAMSREERRDKVKKMFEGLYTVAVLSAEIVGRDKASLIQTIEENYTVWGPSLMALAGAREDVRAISDLIGSAEGRLASAMAVVEASDS